MFKAQFSVCPGLSDTHWALDPAPTPKQPLPSVVSEISAFSEPNIHSKRTANRHKRKNRMKQYMTQQQIALLNLFTHGERASKEPGAACVQTASTASYLAQLITLHFPITQSRFINCMEKKKSLPCPCVFPFINF